MIGGIDECNRTTPAGVLPSMIVSRAFRALAAIAVAGVLTAVPTASAFACSCAEVELPQAIAQADLAFVGNLLAVEPVPGDEPMGDQQLSYTFEVERARDASVAGRVSVRAWQDNGANCGVTFGDRGRWLIVAYRSEGTLETSGCLPNGALDGAPAAFEAQVTELLPVVTADTAPDSEGLEVPIPVLLVLGAAAIVIGASAWAFLRGPRSVS